MRVRRSFYRECKYGYGSAGRQALSEGVWVPLTDTDEKLLTLPEVSAYLGKSQRWVRMEGRALGLPLVHIGRSIRCDPVELRRWVRQQPGV